jgi:hypothetical protein
VKINPKKNHEEKVNFQNDNNQVQRQRSESFSSYVTSSMKARYHGEVSSKVPMSNGKTKDSFFSNPFRSSSTKSNVNSFSSTPQRNQSAESTPSYLTLNENDLNSIDHSPIIKKSQSMTDLSELRTALPLELISPDNSPTRMRSNSIDMKKEPDSLIGATTAFESLRKIKLYLGMDQTRMEIMEEMGIDWQLKVTKPVINIFSTMIVNSSWQAIKAITIMRADKKDLLNLLTDDSRMREYDDMFDYSTVANSDIRIV